MTLIAVLAEYIYILQHKHKKSQQQKNTKKTFTLNLFFYIVQNNSVFIIYEASKASSLKDHMHKKIMQKAAKALEKDASHYAKEAKHMKGKHKKEELTERKEAKSAAKDLKKRAKKAHEY